MKIIYNNLRKIKSIDIDGLTKFYNLDCGHTIKIPKDIGINQHLVKIMMNSFDAERAICNGFIVS